MKGRALFLLLVFALSLVAMALLPTPVLAVTGEEEVELYPESGGGDAEVTVEGRHFGDYEDGDIVLFFSSDKADVGDAFDDLRDWEWVRIGEVDDGDFTTDFDVPGEIDDEGSEDMEDEEDYDGEIELRPESGGVDTRVRVKGRHFDDIPDGWDIVLFFSSDKADVGDALDDLRDWEWVRSAEVDDGGFTIYFDVPWEINDEGSKDVEDDEDYYVYAVEKGEGKILARAEFEVTRKREMQLDPKGGVVGERVYVSGWGFARLGSIRIFYHDLQTLLGIYRLDREGEFTGIFQVPESTAGGHFVGVLDNEGNFAEEIFWVQPDLVISPDTVPDDSPLKIRGTGFGKEVSVRVSLGGDQMEGTTSDRGSFSLFLTGVNEVPAGNFAVTAEDSYGNRATATLTIIPTISINPIQGTVGGEIEIKGTGFAASEGVTITYDGGRMITTEPVATDFRGSFTTTLTVPPSPGGKHSVAVVDTLGNRHTATFTVLRSLRLHPRQGAVGTSLELEGSGFAAGSSLTITYDDALLNLPTLVTTDSQGSFAITFPAPRSLGGRHTITAATDDMGNTTLSTTFDMEQTPPPPPELRSPEPDQRLGWLGSATPEFDWADVSDPSGVSYTLEIAYSPKSANPIVTKTGLSESRYMLQRAEALQRGSYYWRVKAIDGAGNEGAWSMASPFQVGWLPLWLFIILVLLVLAVIGGMVLVVIPRL